MTEIRKAGLNVNPELIENLESLDQHIEQMNKWLDSNDTAKLSATMLATAFIGVKDFYETLDEIRKKLGAVKDRMSYTLIPRAFEDEGQTTVTLSTGHRVTISSKLRASIGEDKPGAYDWLRGQDFGALIQETVNASSLAALAKELAEKGEGLPEELFNTSIASVTSVTKVRKS